MVKWGRILLELIKEFLVRSAKDVMYFMDLVKFIIAWKQREERKHFKENASHSPVVHLMVVVAICKETLRRSIPPSRNVLSEGRLGVNSSARTKIC